MARQTNNSPLTLEEGMLLRHKKGMVYLVLDTDFTYTEEWQDISTPSVVLYQALYGELTRWVRPTAMFTTNRFMVIEVSDLSKAELSVYKDITEQG